MKRRAGIARRTVYEMGTSIKEAHGLVVVDLSEDDWAQWEQMMAQHIHSLRGTLVDSVMFDRVMELKEVMERPDFNFP